MRRKSDMEKKRLTENSTIITHIVDVNNMFISELRTTFFDRKMDGGALWKKIKRKMKLQ